jgi:hypothetical protein
MNPKQKTTADLKASIDYELAKKEHEDYIKVRRFELDRTLELMKFYHPKKKEWTIEEIRAFMLRRIDEAESMDAPNHPGYYIARND